MYMRKIRTCADIQLYEMLIVSNAWSKYLHTSTFYFVHLSSSYILKYRCCSYISIRVLSVCMLEEMHSVSNVWSEYLSTFLFCAFA